MVLNQPQSDCANRGGASKIGVLGKLVVGVEQFEQRLLLAIRAWWRSRSAKKIAVAGRSPRLEILEVRAYLAAATVTATDTWIGGSSSNNWADPANWSGGVPTDSDGTIFLDGTAEVQIGSSSPPAAAATVNMQSDGASIEGDGTLTLSTGEICVGCGTGKVGVDIAGDSGLTKDGDGTLVLSTPSSTANSYMGATTVNAGMLVATTAAATPDATSLTVGAGGTFIYDPTAAIGNSTTAFPRPWPSPCAPDQSQYISPAGVVYSTDASLVSGDDLAGASPTRFYSSLMALCDTTGGPGCGWMLGGQPYAVTSGGETAVVFSPTQSYWFRASGASFTPLYGGSESLVHDSGVLSLTLPDGTVYVFNDFSASSTAGPALAGQFVACYSPDGSTRKVVASTGPDAQISQIDCYAPGDYNPGGTSTPDQTETDTYDTAGPNTGRLQSTTLQTCTGATWVDASQSTYAYYGGVNDPANGQAGDLQAVCEQSWDSTLNSVAGGWTTTGDYYYRYYVTGFGRTHGLKMALTPDDVAAAGGLSAAEGMSDSALAPYASQAFQYGFGNRVTNAVVNGSCSYGYAYTASTNMSKSSQGIIAKWRTATIETDPNGNVYSVYSNALGQTLIADLADPASGNWYTAWTYATSGSEKTLLQREVMPSAIASAEIGGDGSINLTAPAVGQPQGTVYNFAYASGGTPGVLDRTTALWDGLNASAPTANVAQETYPATGNESGSTMVLAGETLDVANPQSLPGWGISNAVEVTGGATLQVDVGDTGQWTSSDLATLLANVQFDAGSCLELDTTGGNFTY